jgi:hypothetical protein
MYVVINLSNIMKANLAGGSQVTLWTAHQTFTEHSRGS